VNRAFLLINVNRHYEAKHAWRFDRLKGQFYEAGVSELKVNFTDSSHLSQVLFSQSESLVKAECTVAKIITKIQNPLEQ
jgi:hypothetical protein